MHHSQVEIDIVHLEYAIGLMFAVKTFPIAYWRGRVESIAGLSGLVGTQTARLQRLRVRLELLGPSS